MIGGSLLLMALAIRIAWPEPVPPGFTPELARAMSDLRRQPSWPQRLACRLADRLKPGLARSLPSFLQTTSVELRRLEACHRLVAMGPAARPAVPRLVDALGDATSDIRFYAFTALIYTGATAEEIAALAGERTTNPEGPIHLFASLLTTEDERMREFAWRSLEALGSSARVAEARLRDLTRDGEPALRTRAAALLQRWDADPAVHPGSPVPQ